MRKVGDKASLSRIAGKYRLQEIECRWLDTARVVRRAWPQFAKSGYGLSNVAEALGIQFRHHTAQEDARAAGEILLRAVTETGLLVDDWLDRVWHPIDLSNNLNRTRQGNPDGVLTDEVVVFTGALSLPRSKAADLAAEAGCNVAASVTKQTTLLVVGDQDIRILAGHEKSTKHRKAEELIAKGQAIRILSESDFVRLVHPS